MGAVLTEVAAVVAAVGAGAAAGIGSGAVGCAVLAWLPRGWG